MQVDTRRTMRTCLNVLAPGLQRTRHHGAPPLAGTPAATFATLHLERGHPVKRWMVVAACVLGAAALPGCAGYYYGDKYGPTLGTLVRTNLIETNERATDALLQAVALDPSQPLRVATLVNVDRLAESSRLGRLFSEQIAGRIVQHGLRVTEVKLRHNILLQQDQGELLLPREVSEVIQSQEAQAMVVGTYAVSTTMVYISLKLVNPVGNAVVAAHNYAVPMDENVRALLAGR